MVADFQFGATIFNQDGHMGPGANSGWIGGQKPVNGGPQGPSDPAIVIQGDTRSFPTTAGDLPPNAMVLIRISWRIAAEIDTIRSASFLAKANVVHPGQPEHRRPRKSRH